MKTIRRISAVVLSVLMLVCMGTSMIYAADTQHTIKINNETSGHSYEAYQVFKGDISDGKLTNITWGSGVNGDALLSALQELPAYEDCTTAEDVAEVLKNFENNSDEIDAFAAVVGKNLATAAGTSGAATEIGEDEEKTYQYAVNVTGDGYYFVKDKDQSVPNNESYTKYILKVVADVTVDAKDDVPEIDKNIKKMNGETEEKVKITNGSVGDVVDYVIDSKVPNMDGYKSYLFQVSDTMSKGLTFNDDISVKIGNTVLTKDDDFTVDTDDEDATFVLYIKKFIQYKDRVGQPIVITYSATINQDAVVGGGDNGNQNAAKLEYSNNPNQSDPKPDPDNPDEPNPLNPSGTTPESITKTYTSGIELLKVDGSDASPLTGAKFVISGESKKVVIVNKNIFKESAEGTYYRLKDGTYTTDDPSAEGMDVDKYESTEVKYELVTVIDKTNKSEAFEAEGWVNAQGILTFDGLGEGEYEIKELVAPEGYNLLNSPIDVKITFTDGAWTASSSGKALTVADGVVKLTVENKTGTELPSTGGMGTTIFFIVGGVLVVGAAVLLIARKRMGSTDK